MNFVGTVNLMPIVFFRVLSVHANKVTKSPVMWITCTSDVVSNRTAVHIRRSMTPRCNGNRPSKQAAFVNTASLGQVMLKPGIYPLYPKFGYFRFYLSRKLTQLDSTTPVTCHPAFRNVIGTDPVFISTVRRGIAKARCSVV